MAIFHTVIEKSLIEFETSRNDNVLYCDCTFLVRWVRLHSVKALSFTPTKMKRSMAIESC